MAYPLVKKGSCASAGMTLKVTQGRILKELRFTPVSVKKIFPFSMVLFTVEFEERIFRYLMLSPGLKTIVLDSKVIPGYVFTGGVGGCGAGGCGATN